MRCTCWSANDSIMTMTAKRNVWAHAVTAGAWLFTACAPQALNQMAPTPMRTATRTAAGGNTGNGALLGVAEQAQAGNDVLGIGADQDQYFTLPNARPILLSSAMKRVDVATYTVVRSIVEGTFKGGVSRYDMSNDGVGLAAFHDLDSRVSQTIKDQLAQISAGLRSGEIKLDVNVPADCVER